jgi:TrpR family trp operon transcriptional repressor
MEKTLVDIFTGITDRTLMKQFFDEIFTDAERKDLELRWKLMQKLKQGISQRDISAELGISLCKITRGSKIIKNDASATNRLLRENGY